MSAEAPKPSCPACGATYHTTFRLECQPDVLGAEIDRRIAAAVAAERHLVAAAIGRALNKARANPTDCNLAVRLALLDILVELAPVHLAAAVPR